MVHINHDFIAGGKALSAGTYKVYQGSPETGQWLILRSKETGASVFLLPSAHDGAFPGQFEAKLTRAGNCVLPERSRDRPRGLYTSRTTRPDADSQKEGPR